MDNKPSLYDTIDLYLSSYLVARGLRLVNVTRPGPNGKVHFLFDNNDKTQKLIRGFYNNEKIEVGSYNHALRDLKSRMFNTA